MCFVIEAAIAAAITGQEEAAKTAVDDEEAEADEDKVEEDETEEAGKYQL